MIFTHSDCKFFAGIMDGQNSSSSSSSSSHTLILWEFRLPVRRVGIELWVPYPWSDRHQVVDRVQVDPVSDHLPLSWAVYFDRRFQTPTLYISLPSASSLPTTLRFRFSVRRSPISLPSPPPASPPSVPDPVIHALFLESTSKMAPEIVGLRAKLILDGLGPNATPLDKARRIYDWVTEYMSRDPDCPDCGTGDVCVLLDRRKGKCTDIHSVMVALCRVAQIPAREVFGLRLPRNYPESGLVDISGWQHCWVEMLFAGLGWVVCDPSDVLKEALQAKLDDKTAPAFTALRDKYWLQVDAHRVAISMGRDVELQPPPAGGVVLNTFQYPLLQVDGVTIEDRSFYSITATAL